MTGGKHMSESQKTHTGSCLCGAVQYKVSGDPMLAGHCHCIDCRKSAGTGHVTLAMFGVDQFEIEGPLTTYSRPADSGAAVTRSFCPTCGSRLFDETASLPGVKAVMLGTLDNPEAVQPQFHVYFKNHLSWDAVDPALTTFDEMPPDDDGIRETLTP